MGCLFLFEKSDLAGELLLKSNWPGSTWRTPSAIAELANVKLQLGNGAAQGVAMHSQLPRRTALIAFVFF